MDGRGKIFKCTFVFLLYKDYNSFIHIGKSYVAKFSKLSVYKTKIYKNVVLKMMHKFFLLTLRGILLLLFLDEDVRVRMDFYN